MNTAKDYVHKRIDELSEKEIPEVLDYIEFHKSKKIKEHSNDLQEASYSRMAFWDNPLDDEVWNNV